MKKENFIKVILKGKSYVETKVKFFGGQCEEFFLETLSLDVLQMNPKVKTNKRNKSLERR